MKKSEKLVENHSENSKTNTKLSKTKQEKLEKFNDAQVSPRTFVRDSFNNYQDSLSVL